MNNGQPTLRAECAAVCGRSARPPGTRTAQWWPVEVEVEKAPAPSTLTPLAKGATLESACRNSSICRQTST
jgi:hypothetical protein